MFWEFVSVFKTLNHDICIIFLNVLFSWIAVLKRSKWSTKVKKNIWKLKKEKWWFDDTACVHQISCGLIIRLTDLCYLCSFIELRVSHNAKYVSMLLMDTMMHTFLLINILNNMFFWCKQVYILNLQWVIEHVFASIFLMQIDGILL